MTNRRRFERHPMSRDVRVSTVERSSIAGALRNVSRDGALFAGRSGFMLGERITLRFADEAATGQVVRASLDASDDNLFQCLTAVRFDGSLASMPS